MHYGRYLLTLVVVAVVITGSAFAWKTMTRTPSLEATPQPSPSPLVTTSPEAQATEPAQLQGNSFILENPTVVEAEKASKVVVRFSPESSFANTDRLNITKRIIEPYKLYQEELQGTQELLSIDITQNTQASAKDYPFLFSANFDGNVNESFVIARQGDTVAWFVPECMGPCPFGKKFEVQYPEIVKISKAQ